MIADTPAVLSRTVVHLIHKFDQRAGPDVLVAETLKRLDRRLWRPALFMLDFERYSGQSLLEETCPPDVPQRTVTWRRGRGLAEALREFRAFCRETDAAIIHSHDIPSHLTAVTGSLGHRSIRVASVHGVVDQTRRQRQWNALNQLLLSRYDHVLVSAGNIADHIRTVPAKRISLLLNAVDVERLPQHAPYPADLAFGPDHPLRLICVGRLSEEKNHKVMIDAMRGLGEAPVRLDIVGTGPMVGEIKALADGVPSVTVHGFVSDTQRLLCNADVFCLTSIRESMAIGVLEAMATGLPVITTDVGAHEQVVGSSGSGWVIPQNDPVALQDRIRAILANPSVLRQKSENARRVVREDHAMDGYVTRISDLYQNLAASR